MFLRQSRDRLHARSAAAANPISFDPMEPGPGAAGRKAAGPDAAGRTEPGPGAADPKAPDLGAADRKAVGLGAAGQTEPGPDVAQMWSPLRPTIRASRWRREAF